MVFLYASDDKFSGVLACSLVSLLEKGNGIDSEIYIVDSGISDEHKEAIISIAQKYEAKIEFIPAPQISVINIENIDVKQYSMSMFSRIFADTLLPGHDRVIYLDCDTFIMKNLSDLWNTDIYGAAIGAVNDHRSHRYGEALGMSVGTTYINSGVLLIDLKKYRENRCAQRIIDALAVGNGMLEFPDNDIICSVLQNEIYLLPVKYNMISTLFAYSYNELKKYRKPELIMSAEEYDESVRDPYIVHFTRCLWFNGRPWEAKSNHPLLKEYGRIRDMLLESFEFPQPKHSIKTAGMNIMRKAIPRRFLMWGIGLVHADLKPKLTAAGKKSFRDYIRSQRKKNIVILRTQAVNADSRAEKEAYSLTNGGFNPLFLGWNRDENGKNVRKQKIIFGKQYALYQIRVKGKYFQGFRKNLIPMVKFQLRMKKWLKKNRKDIDAIHACDLDTALFASRIAKKYKIPMIYDVYDYYPDGHAAEGSGMYRLLTLLEENVEKNADAVIVCTEERLSQINCDLCKKTEVIHNALPYLYAKKAVVPDFIENNGLVHFVFIGAIIRGRYLMEMIDIIAEKRDTCDMYVGGFGSDEMIGQIREYEKNNSNIHFLGFLQYQDVISVESGCDVIPAVFDPTIGNHRYAAPNKFYEAILLGRPLIMLENTGMDKWVEQYELGKVIKGDTSEEFKKDFSRAVDELIARRSSWNEIARRENELYRERFSWEIMEKRLISLYNGVFTGNGR